jgi:hypothetical protein
MLAISTMQMMQAMSWPQRVPSVATAGAPVVVVVVTSSSQCVLPPRERTVFVLLERPIVAAVFDLL